MTDSSEARPVSAIFKPFCDLAARAPPGRIGAVSFLWTGN
jgi:hypothetical protein